MLKISPLEWTDLNPRAAPFTPREDIMINKNQSNNNSNYKSKVDFKDSDPKPSTSKLMPKERIGEKVESYAKEKVKPNRPSKLTLEQFVLEKLKIENDVKNNTQVVNVNRKKKTLTNDSIGNSLDSSAPTRRRGKEREVPKPKKPTAMKKIITQEKHIKSNQINNNDINDIVCQNADRQVVDDQIDTNACDFDDMNKKILHNIYYREYCTQRLTQEMDDLIVKLLSDLVLFQDRIFSKDPIKAKLRKRLCFGFREVSKYATVNKIKMLVIAPDIEKIESKGGLDDSLTKLLNTVKHNQTPVVFGLTRQRLGISCKKRGFISCIGILNYDGSQDNFKQLISLSENARLDYKSIFEESKDKLKNMSSLELEEISNNSSNIPKEVQCFRNRLTEGKRKFNLKTKQGKVYP